MGTSLLHMLGFPSCRASPLLKPPSQALHMSLSVSTEESKRLTIFLKFRSIELVVDTLNFVISIPFLIQFHPIFLEYFYTLSILKCS